MRMSDKKGKCVERATYKNKRGMREVEISERSGEMSRKSSKEVYAGEMMMKEVKLRMCGMIVGKD